MGSMARWLLVLLSGCSLTLSGPDPNRPRNKPPACDTGKGTVALDGALAATLGLVALGLASDNGAAAVAPALFGGLFLLSAVHGNSTVDACNREMENFASEMAAPPPVAEPAVAQLPSPPPPLPVQAPAPQPPPPAQAPAPPPAPAADAPWPAFWRVVP